MKFILEFLAVSLIFVAFLFTGLLLAVFIPIAYVIDAITNKINKHNEEIKWINLTKMKK